jgi:hypothetical protein
MADLMGVMLKSMGVNPAELMGAANNMQAMVAEIHGMLSTITRQNELIITHLGESANANSAIRSESDTILTRALTDGRISAGNGIGGDSTNRTSD